MKNTIVNFGDSWAWGWNGAQVKNPKRYSVLVAKHFNSDLLDFSQPGTSCANMILQFQKFIRTSYRANQKYQALFFVTAQERQLMFQENGEPKEYWPGSDRIFYQDYYTDHLGEFALNTHLITLQAMCKHYSVEDRYILGWQTPKLWPELDTKKFYQQGRLNMFNVFTGDTVSHLHRCPTEALKYFRPNDMHPNDLGHQRISEVLIDWIEG